MTQLMKVMTHMPRADLGYLRFAPPLLSRGRSASEAIAELFALSREHNYLQFDLDEIDLSDGDYVHS